MDIDFIKWKLSYADGFEWFSTNIIRYRYNDSIHDWVCLTNDVKEWWFNSLLLQKTIEGINLNTQYTIEIKIVNDEGGSVGIGIMVNDKWVDHYYLGYDEAKEHALKYIYKQENK